MGVETEQVKGPAPLRSVERAQGVPALVLEETFLRLRALLWIRPATLCSRFRRIKSRGKLRHLAALELVAHVALDERVQKPWHFHEMTICVEHPPAACVGHVVVSCAR